MAPRFENIISRLRESIAVIFDQAQLTLANHRKNCVALYKLHQQAATIIHCSKKDNVINLVGERAFGDAFIDMVNRVLVVQKGPATVDRVVRFMGSYVKFMNEKVSAEKVKEAFGDSCSARLNDEDDDTVASRFVSRLLKWLFQGFSAKNKITRYRSVSIVSELIVHLGELDEDTYNVLRDSLVERLCDKEPLIRSHAVMALSKLVGSEDPSEIQPGEQTILEVLLDVLCHDPAAEVRRATLLQIPLTLSTISAVLSRTRDTDALTRKLVYSAVLQPKLSHPRQLTIAQREQVVKYGLGDREPSVRVATGKMIASWFDTVLVADNEADDGTWVGDDGGVMKAFVKFLSLFDVVGPGEAVAVDAMLSIFVTRPDIVDVFIFPDAFWQELVPESAVLARVFVEHCVETKNEARLEAASLPVVTAFAFHLQNTYNVLLDILQEAENARLLNAGADEDEEEIERREEDLAKQEIVLSELLRMVLKFDYMDEIGRGKVFLVVRDMLAHPELPPGLIEPALDVLTEIMPTERELIRVAVEIIIELREDDNDDNHDFQSVMNDESQSKTDQTLLYGDKSMRRTRPREELTAEERLKADATDMRCLTLCIGMLERVHGSFEDNSTLEGVLADLIIPCVKRKELAMREKGLVGLGLCCLIAKNMALSSFQLFVSQVQSAPEELKVRVLQVIFDLLFLYNQEFLGRSEDITKRIVDFLLQTLDSDDSARTQAVLCIGFCKLLISGKITDPRILSSLLLIYVTPTTATNYELRQCLSYFFPVYCYSSPANQSRMQSIFITAFDHCVRMHKDLEEDQGMISPYQFGLLVVDWTNLQKTAPVVKTGTPHEGVHVELAIDILAALYHPDRSAEDQKVLCQLLDHLHMSGLDHRSILKLNILLSHHEDQCPFNDASLDKMFNKFRSRFTQIFAQELRRINPRQYQDEEFHKLYEFIGVDIPDQ